MALIHCKECKKEVSDTAKTCPNCGAKVTKKISLFGYLSVIILGLFVYQCTIRSEQQNSDAKVTYTDASAKQANKNLEEMQQKVVEHFKTEKVAKDSLWTSDTIFKVGVIDNGTNREGYAQYVCEVLYDYGFEKNKIYVQVIDIQKLVRNNQWEKLGEIKCE